MTDPTWVQPPEKMVLSANQVHIWRACLSSQEPLLDVLSPEELQRGSRFLQERHRRRFCKSRAFLKVILSKYLPVPPEQIQFQEGPHGKLYLLDRLNPVHLQFNLSHSEDMALFIVALNDEVGIDIEWKNPNIPVLPLAERFFLKHEVQKLKNLSDEERIQTFYSLWTRKEAYLKALGIGLGGLSQVPEESDIPIFSLCPAPEFAGAWCIAECSRQNLASMRKISFFTAG